MSDWADAFVGSSWRVGSIGWDASSEHRADWILHCLAGEFMSTGIPAYGSHWSIIGDIC